MYKNIMVPLDGSELAECVFPHLETVIKGCGVPQVFFVQAVEPVTIPYGIEAAKVTSIEELAAIETKNKSAAEKYLRGIVTLFERLGVKAGAHVVFGKASEVLVDFARKNDVDLVIIATHGRSGVSRWMWGSVADQLLRSICSPILMVRAPGCVL